MNRLEQLKAALAEVIPQVHADKPGYYAWPASELPAVIGRMQAAIDRGKGLRGVAIDSESFKRLAKRFGIKNTYKAWSAWLAYGNEGKPS